jgi:transcriptional regulator GlxA family with amidase domain
LELADYLKLLRPVTEVTLESPFIINHVRQGPVVESRPPMPAMSIIVPTRSLSAKTTVAGRASRRLMRRGDFAILPPETPVDLDLGPLDAVVALIRPEMLDAMARALNRRDMTPVILRRVDAVRDQLLSSLAIELCRELDSEDASRRPYVEALCTSLLSRLVSNYAEQGTAAGRSILIPDGDERIRRAQRYIEANLLSDFHLPDVARHAGMSLPHLTELFRAATGASIWQYVKTRRLEHARKLLETSNLSLQEIAATIGYLSLSHFGQSFRVAFGVGPGTYRRRVAGGDA